MKKNLFYIAFLIATSAATAQDHNSVILKAMQDELDRSMKELHYEEFDRPFYIGYTINDVHVHEVAASLGAIVRSETDHNRFKNVRVLVGDYDFNDESLDNNLFSAPDAADIGVPIDDDYFGIRRALWASTDNVYKNAARQFKKNGETLKEKNKTLAEMPHRRFAKTEVVRMIEDLSPHTFPTEKIESDLRALTALFAKYPDVINSMAYVSGSHATRHFVSSEGAVIRTTDRIATLQISAQFRNADGELSFDQLMYHASSPEKFPEIESIKAQIIAMCERQRTDSISFDEYDGPVLFTGPAVGTVFNQGLFAMRESLVARNEVPNPNGARAENPNAIDTKFGKIVIDNSLTVRALPARKSFGGKELLASYRIDDEGVLADTNLLLIDKGILKNLLNDRTLVKDQEQANGHGSGASVIEVTTSDNATIAQLKAKLIEKVKAEGLEFGVIIMASQGFPTGNGMVRIFPDGKEEPFTGTLAGQISMRTLKKVDGATQTQTAHNIFGLNRSVISFIVPDAILLDDIQVRASQPMMYRQENYVPRPSLAGK